MLKISAGTYQLVLDGQTQLMGIINVTPDSFSQDGCLANSKNKTIRKVLSLSKKFINEGVDILDIGGESTRPGAKNISFKEEIDRVIPVIQELSRKVKCPISVDTYKTIVAKHALDAGAVIINNIRGINPSQSLLKMVRNYEACIVLMHMKGNPETMQKRAHYNNVTNEIIRALKNSIENCLEIGIKSDRIIIDPGIGFGKSVEHNLEIINHLEKFRVLKYPLLIGTSRKSFIGKILNKDVHERLFGTLASVCASVLKGADIVRVHDIKATKQAVTIIDAIKKVK